MNYGKIKALEDCILEAIKKHDCDPNEATKFAEECFAAQRVRDVDESMIKSLKNQNNSLLGEIYRHKTCISNLRGYIDFLEKENSTLQRELE